MTKVISDDGYPKKLEVVQPVSVTFNVPTESIELPSKGLVYPKDHPLSSGYVMIKHMTAKEEDILTTESFIKNETVLDKFLQSLLVQEGVYLYDFVLGDIDALMVAARIFGYGPIYDGTVQTPSGKSQPTQIDLSELQLKFISEEAVQNNKNEFKFQLPASKVDVVFKLLTNRDEHNLQAEIKRQNKPGNSFVSTATKNSTLSLKYILVEVNGSREKGDIEKFVESMLAYDARALRKYIAEIEPGVNLSVEVTDKETGEPFQTSITLGIGFLWPDAKLQNAYS